MRINCDARGFYWYCLTCYKKGRHTNDRAKAANNGHAHLRQHLVNRRRKG
jgi:hypothetical protein